MEIEILKNIGFTLLRVAIIIFLFYEADEIIKKIKDKKSKKKG